MHDRRRSPSTSERSSSTGTLFSYNDGLIPKRVRTIKAVRHSECTITITEWTDGFSVTNASAEKRNAAGIFPAVLVQMQGSVTGNLIQ
jgi:hypothetical protein